MYDYPLECAVSSKFSLKILAKSVVAVFWGRGGGGLESFQLSIYSSDFFVLFLLLFFVVFLGGGGGSKVNTVLE